MSERTDKAWQKFSDSMGDVIDSMFSDVDKTVREAEKSWKPVDGAALRFTAKSWRARFKIAGYFAKRAAECLLKGRTNVSFKTSRGPCERER